MFTVVLKLIWFPFVDYPVLSASIQRDPGNIEQKQFNFEVLPKMKLVIPASIIMNQYATGMTQTMHPVYPNLYHLQWNLRIKDTFGAEFFVLFSEVVLWWEVQASIQFLAPSRPNIPR